MRRAIYNPGVILIAINIGWVIMLLVDQPKTLRLMSEDNVVEWLQFLFFAIASMYCLWIAGKGETRLVRRGFLALAALAALAALEEISWGQNILNFETPESIKSWNYQDEVNLHNYEPLQGYRNSVPFILLGAIGLASIELKQVRRIGDRLRFFLPPGSFRLLFGIILVNGIVLGISHTWSWQTFWFDQHAEIGEMGIAITMFAYAYTRYLLLTGGEGSAPGAAESGDLGLLRTLVPGGVFLSILPVVLSLWLLSAAYLGLYDLLALQRLEESRQSVPSTTSITGTAGWST